MSDSPPETRLEPAQAGQAWPDIEARARQILGLDEIETVPNALPVRAEHLWRADRFAAHVPFTNPMFVPMGPAPDIGLLYEAVAGVVERHPALRTRLAVQNGRAVQIVEDWKATGLELVNIRKQDLLDDRPGVKSAISEFTQVSTDLYAQDGFHCRAFRDEDGDVTLGFLAHGFFSDAWSSQLLLHEVRAVCAALERDLDSGLKSVRHYIDYAQDQRRSLDADLAGHLSFWHAKLRDMPAAKLPYDHQQATGRRGRSYFFVRDDIVARLTALCQASRLSLTLLLLAAYQLSLARWSGQSEILSAAYTADRVKAEFRDTVGFLVGNMPVSTRIDKDMTFRDFLRDFARDFYSGYAHRELSCELYEAIFAPAPSFCASVFNFVPLQKNFFASELHSVPSFDEIIVAPPGARPAIYREIYLGLAQYPNGILGKVFYNADLFSPQGIEVFIGNFRHVIGAIAADPDTRLKTLLA